MTKLNITPIPETTAVLLGGTGKSVFDEMRAGLISLKVTNPHKDRVKFNQSELTLISKLMQLADSAIKEEKDELTALREKLWQQCNKEDIATASEFKTLNQVKTQIKKMRKLREVITSINTKVKKQTKELQ